MADKKGKCFIWTGPLSLLILPWFIHCSLCIMLRWPQFPIDLCYTVAENLRREAEMLLTATWQAGFWVPPSMLWLSSHEKAKWWWPSMLLDTSTWHFRYFAAEWKQCSTLSMVTIQLRWEVYIQSSCHANFEHSVISFLFLGKTDCTTYIFNNTINLQTGQNIHT